MTPVRTLCVVLSLLSQGCASSTPSPVPAATGIANVQILAFNDFHGALAPPSGAHIRPGPHDRIIRK